MFSINLKRRRVTLAVVAGLLAVAGPASASSTDLNGGGQRIHASPSTAIFIMPDNGPDLVIGGVVTDNKDPDKVWADHAGNASNVTGAVVAADFNYYERATALLAPLGASKGSFVDGHRAAIESGYETKTRPHADGAVPNFLDIPAELGFFFDIPAELKSPR